MTVSIITPSFNQAEFLPACLDSVARQTVRPLEHIVLDPGSTDGSREIAAACPGVTLIAEPDEGQADAVGKGFALARGEVIGWLNSDDQYASDDVLAAVLARFGGEDKPDIVYGTGSYIDEQGKVLRSAYVNGAPDTLADRLHREVGILQPAVFLRREAVLRLGPPSKDLSYCMDYEYWIRALKAGLRFAHIARPLALARYYPRNKTFGKRGESYHEVCRMLKGRFGYVPVEWLRRYAEFRVKGHDGILNYESGAGENTAIMDEVARLLHAFDNDHSALSLLGGEAVPRGAESTLAAMRDAGIPLRPVAREVDVDTKSLPGKVCYTVGARRWAFEKNWKEGAVARSAEEFRRIRKDRSSDTCVVVGNGPSLNLCDLSLLEGADVFISNYAFLKPELAARATYFSVVNHLVAEQGADHISLFRGARKFFPYWLRYCIADDPDAFFVNSVGYAEFSTDIFENISWRSTVTFFNLQLAYGLGYRKVLMIGFDHHYKQDPGVKEGDELFCREDDANHFDPGYFKNKLWQAADVGNMERMYLLAKTAFEADGREIVNCTVGGHLEVFRRGDLAAELAAAPTGAVSPRGGDEAELSMPRLLVIDSTPIGSVSATGQLKQTYLAGWPEDRLLQIWSGHGGAAILHALRPGETVEQSRLQPLDLDAVSDLCRAFGPEAVYFRPVDDSLLMSAAERIIAESRVPFAIHMMDDWPGRLRGGDPARFRVLDESLRRLISRASLRWSICDRMSEEYLERYGHGFEALANGADPTCFPAAKGPEERPRRRPFRLRYLGALARDMTFDSVMDIARAVADLQGEVAIEFDIHTMDWCRADAERICAGLAGVRVCGLVPWEEYHATLSDSDCVVIAYNFDPASIAYTRLSFANKLPECLASGAVLLAYGPGEVASIGYLRASGCACVVDARDPVLLKRSLAGLVGDPESCRLLAAKARDLAERCFSPEDVRGRFREGIARLARSSSPIRGLRGMPGPYPREDGAHFDETDAVAALFGDRAEPGVMIDVGAHHGTALARFLDRGWRIWAFEPDAENRSRLEEHVQGHSLAANVVLDSRCVGKEARTGLPFYTSDESTGISGLSAFRDSHREARRVDMVSLTEFFKGRDMPVVDFLKIDTEGHDLFVLQGFPWDRDRPAVIECEFEDIKTVPLGYTMRDMADFLEGKGYTVYVSEWHPILRYGQRHDWNRLRRYPCGLSCPDAWGNLLAFASPPSEEAVCAAIRSVLGFHRPKAGSGSAAVTPCGICGTLPVSFAATPHFVREGETLWSVHLGESAGTASLTLDFAKRGEGVVRWVGLVRIEADRAIAVTVSLACAGHPGGAGGMRKVLLAPDVPQTLMLVHEAADGHAGAGIRLETEAGTGPDVRISLSDVWVLPVPSREKGGDAPNHPVRQGNRHFRMARYAESLMHYLEARCALGMKAMDFNIRLALSRLGVTDTGEVRKVLAAVSPPLSRKSPALRS